MNFDHSYKTFFTASLLLVFSFLYGQTDTIHRQYLDSTQYALEAMKEQRKKWGPNDTITIPAVYYHNEIVGYKEEEMVWVSKLSPAKLEKFKQEWTRLRNAVYVTYPYARIAGATINDINAKMTGLTTKIERKAYIKSREKELRAQFGDPLTNLSVYQGKVLMKLINRETGNNCYEIIKEYQGGLTARFYQTVAFFFNSNLKQPYDAQNEDKVIEKLVLEVQRMYGYQDIARNQRL